MTWDASKKAAWQRDYLARKKQDPEFLAKYRQQCLDSRDRYRAQLKELVLEFKKNGCLICPEKDPACLSAHHLDPRTKKFAIGAAAGQGHALAKVKLELKKCICLCDNCHRRFHAGTLHLRSLDVRRFEMHQMMRYEQLYFKIMVFAEKEKDSGAAMYLNKPERWFNQTTWRCLNDHVSSSAIETVDWARMICAKCQAPAIMTFPEDKEGPLQEP